MAESHLRALKLLEYLVSHPESGSMEAVATASGVGRATAYRMVEELLAHGWLVEAGSPRRLTPSLRVAQLGLAMFRDSRVREVLFRAAVQLAAATNGLCLISFYENGEVIYTDQVRVFGETISSELIGARLPAACSAPGKSFMAELDPNELEVVIGRGLPAFTSRTRTTPELIREDIDRTRALGYGFADGEHQEGTAGVAMLVHGRDGQPVGALSIGRQSREPRIGYPEDVLEPLRLHTVRASAELGFGHRASRALA